MPTRHPPTLARSFQRGARLAAALLLAAACDGPTRPTGAVAGAGGTAAEGTGQLHPFLSTDVGDTVATVTELTGAGSSLGAMTAVGGAGAASLTTSASTHPNILMLEDRVSSGTIALENALIAAGFTLTRVVPEYAWNGSNPSLTNFAAVVHLDGSTWATGLAMTGQLALTSFVQNGGGYIASQWMGYERVNNRANGMLDLVISSWPGPQNCGDCTVTYSTVPGQSSHPVLAGLPSSFTFDVEGHSDLAASFSTNPPLVLMHTASGGPGVMVREVGAGRVVSFSVAPNYADGCATGFPCVLLDANIQRLFVNAVNWSARNAQQVNHAPVAAVGGPYTGSEGSAVALALGASDVDNDVLSLTWDLGDGTTGNGAPPASHTYTDNGTYTITLTANDGHEATTATTTATIANVAPVVAAGSDVTIQRGASFTLGASFTDAGANDHPWHYVVGWGEGTGALATSEGDLAAIAPIAPSHVFTMPGTHTVGVSVTDKDGAIGTASVEVTVLNNPPVASAGGNNAAKDAYAGAEGVAIAFDGSASSDPDGDALTYAWSFGDGATATGAKPSHAYGDNGSYAATLTVTDEYGGIATATVPVVVSNVNPTATFSVPATVAEGSAAVISLVQPNDVDADLPGLTYEFDCGSGFGAVGSAASASCPTSDNGTLAVRGRIHDKDGGVSEYGATVTILNVAPTVTGASIPASLTLHGGSATGTIANVTFTDPGANDAPFTTDIDCGNGTHADASGACTYNAIGTYTVRVTVTDKDGGVSTPFTGTTAVYWNWTGFFSPVSNTALNIVKAGSAVPLKFNLDGNQGLNVFAAGFPATMASGCATGAATILEETTTAGASSLSYDPGSGQYIYVWKTEQAWAGSCRQLVVKLADGSTHRANFQFR